MRIRLGIVVCVVLAVSAAADAQVQNDTQVTAGGSLLVSLQPIDDFYVGGPYLNAGIGGIAPGMSVTATAITPGGFVVAAEWSTAWFEREQGGRLVGGPCPADTPPNECSYVGGVATTRLRDPLLSGLAGAAHRRGNTETHFLGGVGWIMRAPTVNGVEMRIDRSPGTRAAEEPQFARSTRPVVVTGGLDVIQQLSPRTSFAAGARYVYVQRNELLRFLGLGNHIVRFGGGIRIRLN